MAYRILVVDDDAHARELMSCELADEGYEVLAASEAAGALELISRQDVHLVLLDIRLKGESGLELLNRLSRERKSLPVILSTAFECFRDDRQSWEAAGYVVKSSNLAGLKGEVRRVLKKHYQRMEAGR